MTTRAKFVYHLAKYVSWPESAYATPADPIVIGVVDDVDAFHERALREAAEVRKAPRDEPWGMREMALRTVDGHRMMLATKLDAD